MLNFGNRKQAHYEVAFSSLCCWVDSGTSEGLLFQRINEAQWNVLNLAQYWDLNPISSYHKDYALAICATNLSFTHMITLADPFSFSFHFYLVLNLVW